ncbi:protein BNIP5 isoform X2 [Psammomys obesus]|uniref:protein BNIP5 isoform X2 n=1 Tax=Psammomys obesus TaxID=48139 RepID=UPI0024531DB6|nr:protein BNIP5 isoform X2 [Psammomys obesus]
MPSTRNPSPGVSRDSSGLRPLETLRGPRNPPADKRVGSLDRQVPRKASESPNSGCPSGPSCRRTASEGARGSGRPPLSTEARGPAATALPLGEGSQLLPSEQGPSEDTKKERPPKPAQQGWVRMFLNFLLLGLEEPREKANRKSKAKGERTEPLEWAEEPALSKKSQEKRAGRKKHSHRKPDVEEPRGPQNSEIEAKEADLGLSCGGALPTEGGHAESPDRPAQAAGPPSEEDPQKLNQDEVIWQIVELLKKAGDQLEEQEQAPQPEVAPQRPTPPPRKKTQEKKSSLKRALSFKRLASEEPRREGAATAAAPETRPKRPSFLPLCVSSQRTSTCSSQASEAPGAVEGLSVDGGGLQPSELHTPAGCREPTEKPLLDRASESREFRRKILALLQNAEEQKGEQQEAEEAGENPAPAPAGRVKAHGKKSNLRRAFSLRKHSSKDSKRTEASGTPDAASSPEAKPPKRHTFLPLCVGGHRASISSGSPESLEFQKTEAAGGGPAGSPEAPFPARSHPPQEGMPPEGAFESKEFIISKLVEDLQEVDSELGRQIRQHPSFRRFFNEFSEASLRKLAAALDGQRARLSGAAGSLADRPPPCAFGSLNKFAANHSCAICTLMQTRGQYPGHSYAHFLSRKARQDILSLDGQSPD